MTDRAWNAFYQNIQAAMKKRNLKKSQLAKLYRDWEVGLIRINRGSYLEEEARRRRITRLVNGDTSLSLKDLWIFSQILHIDPIVLAYGNAEEFAQQFSNDQPTTQEQS